MKGYLLVLGAIVATVSVIGGALHLAGSYDEYHRRLQTTGAAPGTGPTVLDIVKWEFAKIVGGAILFGGVILGSVLMGLGWIGKTLEDIRAQLGETIAETTPLTDASGEIIASSSGTPAGSSSAS